MPNFIHNLEIQTTISNNPAKTNQYFLVVKTETVIPQERKIKITWLDAAKLKEIGVKEILI